MIPEGYSLTLHSDQQFPGHLVDFAAALKAGILFPQWSVFARNGFGSPYLGYYQPGFYYLASICLWLTKSPQNAIALAATLLSITGAAGMFWLSREIFRSTPKALRDNLSTIATAAFLCHPYHLVNLYQRGDYSEFGCAMVLPWAILMALRSSSKQPRRWLDHLPATAVALAACVILHPLIAYPLFLVLGVLSRRLWPALANASLLSAFYWVPLLAEMPFISVAKAFVPELQPARHLMSLAHSLLINDFNTAPTPFTYQSNWCLLALTGCGMVLALRRRAPFHRIATLATGTTIGLIFMMTPASLWIWEFFPLLSKLQFPWRLQNFAAISTAILAVLGVVQFRRVGTFSAIVIISMLTIPVAWNMNPSIHSGRQIENTDDLMRSKFLADSMDEWMPKTATMRMGDPDQPALTSGPCLAAPLQRNPGRISIQLTPNAPSHDGPPDFSFSGNCIITIPQFYYPVGWHSVLVPGQASSPRESSNSQELEIRNQAGFIQISVPGSRLSQEPQQLELSNKMTPWRRLGVGVSLITAISIAGLSSFSRRRRFQTDDSLTS